MAYYAALASLVGLLEDILVRDRYPNFLRSNQTILESLHKKFLSLETLLQEYYSSKGVEVDDRVRRQIRDVSYQAQDAIESLIYQEETTAHVVAGVEDNDSASRQIRDVFHRAQDAIDSQVYLEETIHVVVKVFHRLISACQSQSALSWQPKSGDWSQVLMEMEEEVDFIVQKMTAVIERRIKKDSQSHLASDFFDTAESSKLQAPVGDDFVIGFDEHLMKLKDQLAGNYRDALKVIAVTGMAGIGKTTLVRNIFNDALILKHFDCRVWVTVSHIFDISKVSESMYRSLGGKMGDLDGGVDELTMRVYQHLYGRRYLIVLDDIWSLEVWDTIKRFLPENGSGSRIIITTRMLVVARPFQTLEMHLLDQDHSWDLFRMKVFGHDDYPELKEIGESIVRKCGGLPLAIVIVAGLLSNNKTPKYWEDVAAKVSAFLMETSEDLSNILSLSYNHLPLQLRPCFLFMGIFPEDYEIDVFVLKQMWIAEGFLKVQGGDKTLEHIAQDCLHDFVQRNLVSITKKNENGQFLWCTLHDTVREFCQKRALYEGLFDVEQEEGYSHSVEVDQVRRINLKWERGRQNYLYSMGTLVRSILWFGARFHHDFGTIKWDRCKLLRILHAPNTQIWSLPDAVFQMFHLKYLTLNVFETDLPGSLFMLRNLQTLVIDVCKGSYAKLPPEFWSMTQLRHCLISSGMFLSPISLLHGIPAQKLEDLQTLMTVVDFRFTADSIQMIPNLKKLGMRYGKHYSSGGKKWEMNCLRNLVHLSQLEELSIRFALCNEQHIDSFPSRFSFPKSLTDLTLSGCRLPWEDASKIGSLPHLQVLRLSHEACVGETWEPIEGEFVELKFLLMEWLDLKWWRADDSHFPRLEHLEINVCHELEEIPLDLGNIPTLKFVHVYASKYAGISASLIQEDQQYYGNDELQVKVLGKSHYC